MPQESDRNRLVSEVPARLDRDDSRASFDRHRTGQIDQSAGAGIRIRFEIDDWQRLNLGISRRVPVRLPGKGDVWLFIGHVTELPPSV